MPRQIHPRWLGVAFLKDLMGEGEEGIEYRLAGQSELGMATKPEYCPVRSEMLDRLKQRLESDLMALLAASREGRPRGSIDVEANLAELAKWVLPSTGMAALFHHDDRSHPWLDVCPPALANLPWEAFTERFRYCLNDDCPQRGVVKDVVDVQGQGPGYCHCGHAMHLVERKLGLERYLTHAVQSSSTLAPAEGRDFLILANPTEDLFDTDTAAGRYCRDHVLQLMQLLKSVGYRVDLLQGPGATADAVLEYLQRPNLVGVYYFGHGFLEEAGNEGCLVLNGRGRLFAREIEQLRPRCPFVFINACHGASVGRSWGRSQPLRSMAHAFASGGRHRVVIAPIWPVAATQAAHMALDFFKVATKGARLSMALRSARRRSYRRYLQDQPDIAWAAYRYFGIPDRTLPSPREATSTTSAPALNRMFDEQGQFGTELFLFPIDELMLRAAKRRNLQRRARVSPTDLLAGLVRRGELTRTALRRLKCEPDSLYAEIQDVRESPSPEEAGESPPPADSPAAWVVERKQDFRADTLSLLQRADEIAQQREGDGSISERDLLGAFLESNLWQADSADATGERQRGAHHPTGSPTGFQLPSRESVRQVLDDTSLRQCLDDNGSVILDDLEPAARKVIDRAHQLAQMRGICPIHTRLMFAAFLMDEDGYAARICQRHEVHVENLAAILIRLAGGQGPEPFRLGEHAASKVIQPMLSHARKIAGGGPVDEACLFQAFCHTASLQFKNFARSLPRPWRVDLDGLFESQAPSNEPAHAPDIDIDFDLGQEPSQPDNTPDNNAISREMFEDAAWQRILLAANWARLQGWQEIRSVHLCVALLAEGNGVLKTMLSEAGISSEYAKIALLALTSSPPDRASRTGEASSVYCSGNAALILKKAISLSRQHQRQRARLQDLEEAVLSLENGVVVQQLKRMGVDPRPWWMRHRTTNGRANGKHT